MGEWGDFVTKLGVPGCLLLFIFGLKSGWWHMDSDVQTMKAGFEARITEMKSRFDEMQGQRDFYRDRAWEGAELTELALTEAERNKPPGRRGRAEPHAR